MEKKNRKFAKTHNLQDLSVQICTNKIFINLSKFSFSFFCASPINLARFCWPDFIHKNKYQNESNWTSLSHRNDESIAQDVIKSSFTFLSCTGIK